MPQTIDNMIATWNNAATTFTAIKMAITDTASNASSLLMDLQVGGSSKFKVSKTGNAVSAGGTGADAPAYAIAATGIWSRNSNLRLNFAINGSDAGVEFGSSLIALASGSFITWTSGTLPSSGQDLFLTRRAAANLRLGAADTTGTTAPTAQTLSVQSWTSSTNNNQQGANFTIAGSQGTGTGAGGSIIFQVAPAGGVSNGVQNALVDALTLTAARALRFGYVGYTTNGSFLQLTPSGFNLVAELGRSGTGTFGSLIFAVGGNSRLGINNSDVSLRLPSTMAMGWANTGNPNDTTDLTLWRDAANTLALRNGGTSGSPVPQTFRVYNWTDGTNGEWLSVQFSSNLARIGTNSAGTGVARELLLGVGGGSQWALNTSGHLITYGSDNTYDIGTSGGSRPRNVYVAGQLTSTSIFTGTINGVIGSTTTGPSIRFSATGNTIILYNNDNTQNDFSRLQFGGTTSSFPALKRSSTTLQARLADDSGFASVQGKLTTDTAYTAGDPTTTGYLVVYDSNGTAYKIPAVAV